MLRLSKVTTDPVTCQIVGLTQMQRAIMKFQICHGNTCSLLLITWTLRSIKRILGTRAMQGYSFTVKIHPGNLNSSMMTLAAILIGNLLYQTKVVGNTDGKQKILTWDVITIESRSTLKITRMIHAMPSHVRPMVMLSALENLGKWPRMSFIQ